jgi:hypothetical protein
MFASVKVQQVDVLIAEVQPLQHLCNRVHEPPGSKPLGPQHGISRTKSVWNSIYLFLDVLVRGLNVR